jgi:hypothetical protein
MRDLEFEKRFLKFEDNFFWRQKSITVCCGGANFLLAILCAKDF